MARLAARFVDQILKGIPPGDLAAEYATEYKVIINLRTAKELGITVPPQLLARADEAIEYQEPRRRSAHNPRSRRLCNPDQLRRRERYRPDSWPTGLPRLSDNSANRREHVLNTVVEFGIQRALMLLCAFALCDVNVDAYHSLRTPIFTVRNRTASLDPSDLTC